jgi:peptidoglycan/xylan/chitin deacetylase (PgdA/CDA1 family)
MHRYLFFVFLLITILALPGASQAAEGPNLIGNQSFETAGSDGLPVGWGRGRWGTNTTVFTYPASGLSGLRAAKVDISSYSSGDAKWYFNDVAVTPGVGYVFRDQYTSSATSYITLQYRRSDGSYAWTDLGVVGPSASAASFQKMFTVPAGVTSLTVFHLIKSVGSLTVDNYELRETTSSDPSRFNQGFVSINFDDGWRTTFENALPILDQAGLKSTNYIITGRFDFPAYIDAGQTKSIYTRGHEVGAHTRTHRDLATLSDTDKRTEIAGSKNDLEALGIQGVNSFAYPFGSYNSATDAIVKQSGFSSARTSDGGFNTKNGNKFLLKRQPIENTATFAQVKGWIDQARSNRTWLILLFHRVDTSGTQYSITPTLFKQIVDYLKSQNVSVVTTSQGVAQMAP